MFDSNMHSPDCLCDYHAELKLAEAISNFAFSARQMLNGKEPTQWTWGMR